MSHQKRTKKFFSLSDNWARLAYKVNGRKEYLFAQIYKLPLNSRLGRALTKIVTKKSNRDVYYQVSLQILITSFKVWSLKLYYEEQKEQSRLWKVFEENCWFLIILLYLSLISEYAPPKFLTLNALSANPTKWPNTLKSQRIVWVCLTISWGCRLKG